MTRFATPRRLRRHRVIAGVTLAASATLVGGAGATAVTSAAQPGSARYVPDPTAAPTTGATGADQRRVNDPSIPVLGSVPVHPVGDTASTSAPSEIATPVPAQPPILTVVLEPEPEPDDPAPTLEMPVDVPGLEVLEAVPDPEVFTVVDGVDVLGATLAALPDPAVTMISPLPSSTRIALPTTSGADR